MALDLIAGPAAASGGASGPASGGLRTEFPFVLPRGYVDDAGTLHREGSMRLATARDEITPAARPAGPRERGVPDGDAAVPGRGPAGQRSPQVTPQVVEGMFASDLAFLQDLYRRVNQEGTSQAAVTCPACSHEFTVEIGGAAPGGS